MSGRLRSSEAAPSLPPPRATPPSHDADRRRPSAPRSAHRRRIAPPPLPGSSRRPAPAARSALALPPRVRAFVPSSSASFAPTPAFLRNAGTVEVVPILTFDQHLTNRQPRRRRGRAPHRSGCAAREQANRRAAPSRSSGRAGRAAGRAPAGPRPRRARPCGHMTESMPSRLTPRSRNGMTLAGRSLPPASPQAATPARYLSCVRIVASVLPPTASIAPAQRSRSSGRVGFAASAARSISSAAPRLFEIVAQFRPPGRGDDPVAERRQQRDRDAADPAGSAGDQHLSQIRLEAVAFEREQRQHRGEPGGADRHRLLGAQTRGTMHQPVGLDARPLGIAAPVQFADPPAGQDHRIAGLELGRRRIARRCRRNRCRGRADTAAPDGPALAGSCRPCSSASNTRPGPSPRPAAAATSSRLSRRGTTLPSSSCSTRARKVLMPDPLFRWSCPHPGPPPQAGEGERGASLFPPPLAGEG